MDPVDMISLLADIPQLCEYASRVYRSFNPKDSAMVAWKVIVDSAAETAVHAHGGDLSPGQQTAIFGRLHELLAANDERAWSVLGGPAAVSKADLGDFSPAVVGLVETFSRELTAGLAAEASRPGSPLTNLSVVSSLSSIGGGVNRIEAAVGDVSRRMETVAESVLSVVSDRAADLSETPVPVQRALAAARQIDEDGASRLERIITSGQSPAAAITQVLGPNPPGWWRSAAGVTVIAAGEYAAAYGHHAAASRIFESAADLEITSRARCLARAALESSDGDPSRAAGLAERALQLEGDDLFVLAVPAVLARDFGAALDLLGSEPHEDDPEMLILAGMQRLALANTERLSDAISVARRSIELRPDAAGMLLQLALMLRTRAESNRASREADLAEAMDAALRARDLRRTWHGDSAEAVAIACEIAHQLEDRSTIRRLGLEPPDGDAIRTEAADENVIAAVAVAAAIDGDDALAERLLPQVTSSFHRHMLLGMKSARRGESEIAARELREAVSEADDDSHLAWALRGLATLGEWPLPGFEELAERSPTEAEVIRGISELNRDLIAEGIRRLSVLRRTSPVVPVLLAEAHEIGWSAGGRRGGAAGRVREVWGCFVPSDGVPGPRASRPNRRG